MKVFVYFKFWAADDVFHAIFIISQWKHSLLEFSNRFQMKHYKYEEFSTAICFKSLRFAITKSYGWYKFIMFGYFQWNFVPALVFWFRCVGFWRKWWLSMWMTNQNYFNWLNKHKKIPIIYWNTTNNFHPDYVT